MVSITTRYNLINRLAVYTLLPVEELKLYQGITIPREIHLYQQKVGSASYITTITRLDAAKATA